MVEAIFSTGGNRSSELLNVVHKYICGLMESVLPGELWCSVIFVDDVLRNAKRKSIT